MSRLCEICGIAEKVEEEGTEEKTSSEEISMSILHLCDNCLNDRQH